MLKDRLYDIVAWIARVHESIWAYNRGFDSPFTDKELHFIVIGATGTLLLLLALPLFRFLSRRGRGDFLAWLFTLTAVMLIAFAIEIGQHMTNTGSMELEDIVYGVIGFLAASGGFFLLYLLFRFFRWLFRK